MMRGEIRHLLLMAGLLLVAPVREVGGQPPPNPTASDGFQNTAGGTSALISVTPSISVGSVLLGGANTAFGTSALYKTTTGGSNTAVGALTMLENRTGSANTGIGDGALGHNDSGNSNTAVGFLALATNNADDNTAVGSAALLINTTGSLNTAIGSIALWQNETGNSNTAVGYAVLLSNSAGEENTAVGESALRFNTTGNANTALGRNSLDSNSSGNNNTAVGDSALLLSNGSGNIAIGQNAGADLFNGNNNIYIGNRGINSESRTIRIGKPNLKAAFISGIAGATVGTGVPVVVNSMGQLGTMTSSARFKEDIQDIGDTSSALLKLRPVRFRYTKDLDPSGLEQYGLVAEEVAKVYPDLVVYDTQGRPQTVRYHFINAMLLNELQKQEQRIKKLEQALAAQKRQAKAEN